MVEQNDLGKKHQEYSIQQQENGKNSIKFFKSSILRNLSLRLWYLRPRYALQLMLSALSILREGSIKDFLEPIKHNVLHGSDYPRTSLPETDIPEVSIPEPHILEPINITDFEKWITENENLDVNEIKEEIKGFKYKPKFSIITPVYNVEPKWLNKCIESVRKQFYEDWELCLWDDASTNQETLACLKSWQDLGDERIKVGFGEKNEGISKASNQALIFASGEYIALLDNDDEITPDALFQMVKKIHAHPQAEFIYSDECVIDETNKKTMFFVKPDWSPENMFNCMYTGHLTVYKMDLVRSIDGFRAEFDFSQDYDLALRMSEICQHLYHVEKILY